MKIWLKFRNDYTTVAHPAVADSIETNILCRRSISRFEGVPQN